MTSVRHIVVLVRNEDVMVDFSGAHDIVIRSLHEFVSMVVPNIDLARTITVNYSLNDIIQTFKDFIRITPEGPRVWLQDRKVSDKDVILLQLVASRASSLSGKFTSDSMNIAEIQAATGLYPKTISSRLSELTKLGQVEREDSEGGGKYRITTVGVHRLSDQLSKKLRQGQAAAVGAEGSP